MKEPIIKSKNIKQFLHMPTNDKKNRFKKHFWFEVKQILPIIIGFLLLIPMWMSMGYDNPLMPYLGNYIIQLILTMIILFGLGNKFYIKAYNEWFKYKKLGMYTLIILSSTIAFIYSLYIMINIIINSSFAKLHLLGIFQGYSGKYLAQLAVDDPLYQHSYFDCAAAIIVFVLLGDGISGVIKARVVNGLQHLITAQVKEATLVKDNNYQVVNIFDIKINDLLLVKKGERVPTDGILINNMAYIDESIITGESNYVIKYANDQLIGQTINQGEAFIMKATKIGSETVVANIINKVQAIQNQKPYLQKIADKISSYFVPIVILIAFLTFIFYAFILPNFNLLFLTNNYIVAIKTTIAVLIIACPCALGLATPLAIAVNVSQAAKNGVIFNKTEAFEKINKINVIAFDKTGTITEGKLSIIAIEGDLKFLNLAKKTEDLSTHPIAAAFKQYQYNNDEIKQIKITKYEEIVGFGMKAIWKNNEIVISAIEELIMLNYHFDNNELQEKYYQIKNKNTKIIALAENKKIKIFFLLEDKMKKDTKQIIKLLKNYGIKTYMISGDNENITKIVAEKSGIENYFANVKPIEKANIIAKLQKNNVKVAFVGDGINDIVALQQADLAIAMGTGSESAINLSDIILVKNDISTVYKALVLTKRTIINIWWNFLWAFIYNIVAIFFAICSGWLFVNINFEFAYLAVIAMILSEITLLINTLVFRFRKIKFFYN